MVYTCLFLPFGINMLLDAPLAYNVNTMALEYNDHSGRHNIFYSAVVRYDAITVL